MPTANEHADQMSALAESLSPGEQRRLVQRWIDRAIRVYSSQLLDAAGHPAAGRLRALGELVDPVAVEQARIELESLARQPLVAAHPATRSAVSGAVSVLLAWNQPARLWQVAFGTFMLARSAGRAEEEARRQLLEVTNAGAN